MRKHEKTKKWEDLLALAKIQGHLDIIDIEEYLFWQGIELGSEQSIQIVQKLQQVGIQIPENLSFLSPKDALLEKDLGKPSTSSKVAASHAALDQNIERVLSSLESEEHLLLRLRFGIGVPVALSREEVARKFNLSLERVREIESKALRRLRAWSAPSSQDPSAE